MKKALSYIALMAISFVLAACSAGFDISKAENIINKTEISEEEYSELISLYEIGMDDAISFSKKDEKSLSEKDRKEVLTVFAIGMRLNKDKDKLNEQQMSEFNRINQKGNDELKK